MKKTHRVYSRHDTCPRCGSDDTFWNDIDADPDNNSAHFLMYCEGCKKEYQSVFKPAYQFFEETI